ncbi:Atu2307/SP_0267 family LLM class monooxygenase [Sediminibacterium soli]|uniref:Atu2307/SP_0267 family LLM class monooxygenase n=1 Tax=Sediminibacterium soli TaxID=2698829 RepID=UPI00137B2636|nr:Atu2307/SP_0267 family LLM class monooxygenase [Sediminibacterium soli]NCI45248.1 LLM class flavin-dependent oxidoreductase [Sediminibacterium soli]
MELGIMSFADMQPETEKGKGSNGRQRIQDLLEEIRLADQLGLDVFGIGEHHREDYAVSSPAVVLAAAAAITKNIRLSSAVTVLSSDDPVRVYQQFATVDLLSGGRAEIMAGRGSFIESYPLFGYDLEDYDELFSEKLTLLLQLNKNEPVSWQGRHRPAIRGLQVYPHPFGASMPVWIAAGGTPASAVRAANLGLPLMLAIIGGQPQQFRGFIDLYKQTALRAGRQLSELQFGVNNHVFIGKDSQKAADDFFPYYAAQMNRVGRDRGWPPLSRQQYEFARSPQGALMVGSPQQVIDKILHQYELFGNTRFLAQDSVGPVPHHLTMESIRLFGEIVVPAVRKAVRTEEKGNR